MPWTGAPANFGARPALRQERAAIPRSTVAEKKSKSEFWTTLPGVLTGAGALITAVAGLILGLYQYGVLGSKQGAPAKAEPAAAAEPGKPRESENSAPSAALAAADPQTSSRPMVAITDTDGAVTPVFADSLREINQYDKSLHLLNGQSVAFDKIRRIDFVAIYENSAQVRLTLVGNRTLNATVPAGSSILGFHGENDLGPFEIRMEKLRQIAFAR